MRASAVALCVVGALLLTPRAEASLHDENALAERYAPVVRLVAQAHRCGSGEPYRPIDVDALFHQPTVALRGPWGSNDLVEIAPSAGDLSPERYEYHLDFPGNALDPGCGYEQWGRHVTSGTPPTVYAHVASDPGRPGKIALQYWFYYVFNQWNNTHEGDWEMIQLVFDADSAKQALSTKPVEIGYSQHEGAERAAWGADKLEVVDGTHPVVYPAAGSHANFFDSALYLGSSASEGVGCDDTTGPSITLRPVVQTIPNDPTAARSAFPWIGFQGRWGELQRSFYNGPTGPNLKQQWIRPIAWTETWRDRSVAVPGGGALGTQATDFFCGAVAFGSNALRRAIEHPQTALLLLAVLVALIVFGLTRTSWRPTAPLRLARRRAWGQILATVARVYARRPLLFVGIGMLTVPISVVVTLLQAGVLRASSVAGIETQGEGEGILVLLVLVIGMALSLIGLGLVQGATARALAEIDAGRSVGALRAYRLAFDSVRPLLGAVVTVSIVISVLLTSVLLLPIAIWLAVRWALIVPAVELEGLSAVGGLRRSGTLVRQAWFKVGSLIVVGTVLALVAGPFVGALLILLTSAPLALLNVISGLVYAVALPFVGVTTTYVYYDAAVRERLAEAPTRSGELPAEAPLP
jgi:hypothetical protein